MNAARRLANAARLAVAARREREVPWLPAREIARLQEERLRAVVRYAAERVPFWRAALGERGLAPGDVATVDDLVRLPLLDERDVQLRLRELRSPAWTDARTFLVRSSGSAHGHVRKRIYWDQRSQLRKLAWFERDRAVVLRLSDGRVGLRQLWILPATSESVRAREWWDERVFTPRAIAERDRLATDRPFEEVVEHMAASRPMVVYSYGSYAERFFRWLEGVPDAAGLPRVWVYGGDAMDPAWRRRAESRGCAVVSTYQTVEAGRIGFECERRDGFHLNADLVAVRVVDEDGRDVAMGDIGEIVISNLVNRATVLLNARLGDRGALSPDPCPCGRGLPLLRGLEGRVSEVVDLGNGRKVGEMDLRRETGDALDFALQVQLVQSRPGHVVWRVAPREGVAVEDAVRRLLVRMREILGAGTEVGVDVVDEIPTPWSGKHRRVERGDG